MTKVISQNQKLNHLIRRTIIETIQEVMRDPDYNLELQEWVKKRLRERPENFIPLIDRRDKIYKRKRG